MIFFLTLILFISRLCASEAYKIDSTGIVFIKDIPPLFNSEYLVISNEYYQDGIYRLYEVPNNNSQRIVYNGDTDELMHSLTWIHTHGYKDDCLTFHDKLEIAKGRRLSMTCGSISLFALQLCETLAIPARFVLFLTLEEWNTYNNGHSLLEVYRDGKWKLWDIDQRRYFTRNNKDLNALEFIEAVKENNYQIVKFSSSPPLALMDLEYNNYDYSFWYEAEFFSDAEYRKFYHRSAQVLFIRENGVFYFTCEPQYRYRIESYPHSGPFVYIEKKEFMNKFYPE